MMGLIIGFSTLRESTDHGYPDRNENEDQKPDQDLLAGVWFLQSGAGNYNRLNFNLLEPFLVEWKAYCSVK